MPRDTILQDQIEFTEANGVWTATLKIVQSYDSYRELSISAPSQTLCKETAISFMKPSFYGHKK